MKKSFIRICMAAFAAMSFAACSPSAYVLSLESRAPSESGLTLSDKSMSVVYLESPDGSDSLFNNRIADALAYALETEYFEGAEAVKVYNLQKEADGDYSSKDTLSQYIMLLDTDVVMFLDTPAYTPHNGTLSSFPISSKLYVYDSMNKEEEVVKLNGHVSVSSLTDATKAANIGTSLASPLKSKWKKEDVTVLYFDEHKWIDALEQAYDMKWDKAMEKWMELARSGNAIKASSAMYNVALGCFILDQYELALEWLERSDKTYPISLNQSLRTKIKARMK